MRAAFTPVYGPADILEVRDVPAPVPGDHEVLVAVHASTVTAADHRLRAADFPSISALFGRLIIGMFRPKHAVQGTNFAGRIVAVGRKVTRYAIGDDVFGGTMHGAYAEYIAVPEDGPMARKPAGMGYEEAAALPYGAVTALVFLRDIGAVRPGDKVLVVGASGGVGRFAVQVAKHLGAEVTGICGAASFDLVRGLGADHVIDHRTTDFTRGAERYDVIFDVAGVTTFSRCKSVLSPEGRYVTLLLRVVVLGQMLFTAMRRGPRAKFAIAEGDRDEMDRVRDLAERGVLRPVLAESFPLERIAEAHAARPTGTVVVTIRSSDGTASARDGRSHPPLVRTLQQEGTRGTLQFMESHISVAEAAQTFSDVVERVRSRGDVFVVECEGEPICRIAPVAPARRTARDLVRLLQEIPQPDDAYLDAVTEIAQNQPTLPETPWE